MAVESEISENKRHRDKELERQQYQEQEDIFQTLLIDLASFSFLWQIIPYFIQVKDPKTSWHDAKKVIRKDPRYDQSDVLRKRHKEKLFDSHIKHLYKRFAKINEGNA